MKHWTYTSKNGIEFEVFAHPKVNEESWRVDFHLLGHVAGETWDEEPTTEAVEAECEDFAQVAEDQRRARDSKQPGEPQ